MSVKNSIHFYWIAITLLCFITMGCHRSPQPVPVVRHHLPKKLILRYTWTGNKAYSDREEFTLVHSSKDRDLYDAHVVLRAVPIYGGLAEKEEQFKTTLPASAIKDLITVIHHAHWDSVTQPVERIDHTGDYPNCVIDILEEKHQSLKLISTSNAYQGGAWNLFQAHNIFSTINTQLDLTVAHFLDTLRPPDRHWDQYRPNPAS